MKPEQWYKDELRKLIRTCKENARENRKQEKDCEVSDPKRAHFLEGGAEAMEYLAKELGRIVKGKSQEEAMREMLAGMGFKRPSST